MTRFMAIWHVLLLLLAVAQESGEMPLVDQDDNCPHWASQGLCDLEPQKMANCAMSCATQKGLVAEEVPEQHVPPQEAQPEPEAVPPTEEAPEQHVPPQEAQPEPEAVPPTEEAPEQHVPPQEAETCTPGHDGTCAGDAPSPASFAETAEPWKKVTEALKDIEWLTMPLIDKRLVLSLHSLTQALSKGTFELLGEGGQLAASTTSSVMRETPQPLSLILGIFFCFMMIMVFFRSLPTATPTTPPPAAAAAPPPPAVVRAPAPAASIELQQVMKQLEALQRSVSQLTTDVQQLSKECNSCNSNFNELRKEIRETQSAPPQVPNGKDDDTLVALAMNEILEIFSEAGENSKYSNGSFAKEPVSSNGTPSPTPFPSPEKAAHVNGSKSSPHVPAPQVPAPQVPAPQVPALQVPASQVPASQVPALQVPASQEPIAEQKDARALLTEVERAHEAAEKEVKELEDATIQALRVKAAEKEEKNLEDAPIQATKGRQTAEKKAKDSALEALVSGGPPRNFRAPPTGTIRNPEPKPAEATTDPFAKPKKISAKTSPFG